VFTPEVAKAYLARIEFVFTPTPGSGLNMAEIELSVLNRKVNRFIHSAERLKELILQWQQERNEWKKTNN
jgi:transposase